MPWRLDGWQSLHRLRHTFTTTRHHRQASLRQVASETGISNATLSEFENGRHDLTLSKAVELVRWLETGDDKEEQ